MTITACPRPPAAPGAAAWVARPYANSKPDIRREVRLSQKWQERTYIRKVITDLEGTKQRSFLCTDDQRKLQLYRDKLRRLSK